MTTSAQQVQPISPASNCLPDELLPASVAFNSMVMQLMTAPLAAAFAPPWLQRHPAPGHARRGEGSWVLPQTGGARELAHRDVRPAIGAEIWLIDAASVDA